MPSVRNPKYASRHRVAASKSKTRKAPAKSSSEGRTRISKADARRGARPGLLPTSGPKAKMSAKKQRKMEQRLALAVKRRMEAEGEVEMKGMLGSSEAV
jgi:hypothetical protein